MKRFLSVLMILCLLLAGISPACKFISGQSLTEICGADGSIKTMPMPEELAAYLPDNAQEDQEDAHRLSNDDCAFCFAQTHFDQLYDASIELSAHKLEIVHNLAYKTAQLRTLRNLYEARGPPSTLV